MKSSKPDSQKNLTHEGRKITPVDGLLRTAKEWEQMAVSKFETTTAMLLFTHFGLPAKVKWQLVEEHQLRTGESGLTLEAVFGHYPSLPLRLHVCRFRKLPKELVISTMFNAFSTRPFMQAYERLREGLDTSELSGKVIALIHPWPNITHGMCLHECPPRHRMPGVRVQCSIKTKKGLRTFTWQPLVDLLHAIDAGEKWKLEDGDG